MTIDCQGFCKRCAAAELFMNNECAACPERAVCDGSSKMTCQPDVAYLKNGACLVCPDRAVCDGSGKLTCQAGSYLTPLPVPGSATTEQICQECPEGAECLTGTFNKKVPASVWKVEPLDANNKGIITGIYRVSSCPPGFAVTRVEGNPKSDACDVCPLSTYRIDGSEWNPTTKQSGIMAFCKACPRSGASCPGGSVVEAMEGWYVYQSRNRPGVRRVELESAANNTVALVYQCPPLACGRNNTCNGNRTGVLCSYCPEGWAFELNVCVSCGTKDTSGASTAKTVFGIFVSIFVLFVLFLIGWRYVLPNNPLHRLYDKIMTQLAELAARALAKGANSKWQGIDMRLAVQGGKIFFGNLQVVSSFTRFKVELPNLLTSTLKALQVFSFLFTLEIFNFPGVGCLTGMEYIEKLAMRTLMPVFIVLLMVVPTAVSKWLLSRIDKPNADGSNRQERLEARKNHSETKDAFWNNSFTFLFLVFPSSALASMEAFSCRKIGDAWYLNADLRLACPTAQDGLLWFSVFTTTIWAVVVPLYTILSMRWHGIHTMADQKHHMAIVNAMIDRFQDDNVDPHRQVLANIIGNPLTRGVEISPKLRERSNEMFEHIFPDHAQCEEGSCVGHLLPPLPRLMLQKLIQICWREGLDVEETSIKTAIHAWFEDMDINLDATIDPSELKNEFEGMGLNMGEADAFRKVFDMDNNRLLDVDEFESGILQVLNDSVPGLSSFELAILFQFASSNDQHDTRLDSESFYTIMVELWRNAFKFTGTESLEIMTVKQFNALLEHQWERRKTDADNGMMEYNMEESLSSMGKIKEVASAKIDGHFDEKAENHVLTRMQTLSLDSIARECKDMYEGLGLNQPNLKVEEGSTLFEVPRMLEDLIGKVDQVLQDALQNSGHTHILHFAGVDTEASEEARSLASMYNCKRELTAWNNTVKEIFRDLVIELGLKLYREGVINVPFLKWDGSLGPLEDKAIRRFGFLLHAFRVSTWYWEVIDMYRKFLLTGLMVVLFDGSAPHLCGALLITFLFILAHLLVDPYLNQGLNDFQRLALVTQFLTIFGSIIYLMVGALNEIHETKPTNEARDASKLLEIAIILLNGLVIIAAPAWSLIRAVLDTKVSLRTKAVDGVMKAAAFVTELVKSDLHATSEPEVKKKDMYLNAQRLISQSSVYMASVAAAEAEQESQEAQRSPSPVTVRSSPSARTSSPILTTETDEVVLTVGQAELVFGLKDT
jgi:hypothetical protein